MNGLAEASAQSGYSQDHLARLIREGRLPNAGRPHAPRITTVRVAGGGRLLEHNPLAGMKRIREVIGGWLFAAEQNPHQPMDRHLFDKWLTAAERVAKLPKLAGGLWHPLPRPAAGRIRKHSSSVTSSRSSGSNGPSNGHRICK
jgi:hypothetical protein